MTVARLLMACFLAAPILGSVWSSAANLHVTAAREVGVSGESPPMRFPWLPYTHPDSASGRVMSCMERILNGWRDGSPWVTSVMGLTLGTVLSLTVGVVLGGQALIVTAAGLALAWIGACSQPGMTARQVLRVFLPTMGSWLLSYSVLAPLNWVAVALAGLYALAIHAYTMLPKMDHWQGRVLLANGSQFLVSLLLILGKQPLLAGIVTLLLWAQMLLQLSLLDRGQQTIYLRRCNVALMTSMLISAWGLAA